MDQLVDTLGRLADSGHGELALDLLGEIQGVPDSALGEAFAAWLFPGGVPLRCGPRPGWARGQAAA